jgi:integrase
MLKAALNRAWRDGKISSDASWRRVEPFGNVDVARVRYLSIDEATRLINSSGPDFRLVVEGALQTGARYGELTRLRVSDFNSDVGTLTIQQSKSGKARHVVLTDEGEQLFSKLCAGRQGDEIILKKTNGESWKDSHQGRPMAEACRRAHILPLVGIHTLRHTWASHAVMNGVPLLVVAKNLGHADTRMVEKHYGHLAPSYVADAIRSGAPRFGAQQANIVPLRQRNR